MVLPQKSSPIRSLKVKFRDSLLRAAPLLRQSATSSSSVSKKVLTIRITVYQMPPKKKARLISRAASTLSAETPAETMSATDDKATPAREDRSPMKDPSPVKDLLADPWTDEQEISLFKGMVRWKPVGPFPYTINLSC